MNGHYIKYLFVFFASWITILSMEHSSKYYNRSLRQDLEELMTIFYLKRDNAWNHHLVIGKESKSKESKNKEEIKWVPLNQCIIKAKPFKRFLMGLVFLELNNRADAKQCFIDACQPVMMHHNVVDGNMIRKIIYHYYLTLPLLALGRLAYLDNQFRESIKYLYACKEISSKRCDTFVEEKAEQYSLEVEKSLERLDKSYEEQYQLYYSKYCSANYSSL